MRPIDADNLVKHIENKVDMQDVYSPLHIIQFIHREPTISPCVGMECGYEDQCPNIPHGKWIKAQGEWVTDTAYRICFKCSECGGAGDIFDNYCRCCGARMQKGGAE